MLPRGHSPRTILALLIVAGSAALGVTTLAARPAGAATATGCVDGGVSCPPPTGGTATGGPTTVIHTRWTGVVGDGHVKVTVTVTWHPASTPTPPPGAPVPDQLNAQVVDFVCTMGKAPDGSQTCDVPWPPAVEAGGYVLNGQYSVTATAVTCPDTLPLACSSPTAAPTATFPLANPPTAPTVTATLAPAPGTGVVVGWGASPEPDVFAYEVRRLKGSQSTDVYGCAYSFGPKAVQALPRCDPKKLSFTDTKSGGGQFTYQVISYRFGKTYDSLDLVPSPPGQSKGTITVPGAPTTTVAAGKGLPGIGIGLTPGRAGGGGGPNVIPNLAQNAPATTDPGFNPTLPYNQQPAPTDPPIVAAAAPPAPKSHGPGSVGSIALVGAGVLVVAIAVHGLWLRGEVKRSGALEALEPEI